MVRLPRAARQRSLALGYDRLPLRGGRIEITSQSTVGSRPWVLFCGPVGVGEEEKRGRGGSVTQGGASERSLALGYDGLPLRGGRIEITKGARDEGLGARRGNLGRRSEVRGQKSEVRGQAVEEKRTRLLSPWEGEREKAADLIGENCGLSGTRNHENRDWGGGDGLEIGVKCGVFRSGSRQLSVGLKEATLSKATSFCRCWGASSLSKSPSKVDRSSIKCSTTGPT